MTWAIKFAGSAKRELKRLDKQVQQNIRNYLRDKIATDLDPYRFGAPLRKNLSGLWKYRVGDYRVICNIQDQEIVVLVLRVGHRKKVYGGH